MRTTSLVASAPEPKDTRSTPKLPLLATPLPKAARPSCDPALSGSAALEATPYGEERAGSENSALASGVLLCRILVTALPQTVGAASVVSSLLVLGPSNSGLSLSKLSPDESRPSKPPS